MARHAGAGKDEAPARQDAEPGGLLPSEAFLPLIRARLSRSGGTSSAVAVVLVALERRASRTIGAAAATLRDGDVLAALGPHVVALGAEVRPGGGAEAFRQRAAGALLGAAGDDEVRRRSIVVVLEAGDLGRLEGRIAAALDELLARPRPRRRPARAGRLRRRLSAGAAGPVEGTLSQLAIRGGGYLVAREGLGMLVRLVGVVLTVRQIGPASYGIFSAAAAFVVLVAAIAQMGIETYLIRQQDEPTRRDYDVAFTVLVWSSLLATAAALLLTYLVGAWIRPIGVLPELRVLLLSVPVNVLWAPAQAAIERRFRYRAMGLLELGSDVVLYGTAVPLAVLHAGAWSLVAGSLAMQAWLLLGGYLVAGFVPRLAWSSGLVARLLRHGFTFSLSLWAERLRGLVNPLVVGSFAGAAGVGYVAFAQRLVDTLGFARRGTYRLGMVAMGRVGSEQRARLRYAIEEGSALQLVALAVPLVGFGLLAARLVPLLFGHLWLRAVPLCVILSIAAVLGALELVQSTFLFSRGENLAVAGANALSTAVLAGAAVLAVERWGVVGYGVASIASVASLAVVDRAVRRYVHFGYRRLIPLLGIVVPLLAAPLVPGSWRALVAVPLALGLCAPSLRGELAQLYDVVSSSLGRVPRRGAKGRAAGGSAVGAVR